MIESFGKVKNKRKVKIINARQLLVLVKIRLRLVTGPSEEVSYAIIITTAGDVLIEIVAAKADSNKDSRTKK